MHYMIPISNIRMGNNSKVKSVNCQGAKDAKETLKFGLDLRALRGFPKWPLFFHRPSR
jgi:hypothetical protein